MSFERRSVKEGGFTLVELLVVLVIMGLVTMAVMDLYISSQRQTNTSDEVVEVQQNIRFALEQFARDVRLAGLLLPTGNNPVSNAPQFSIDANGDGDCSDLGDTPGFGAGNNCFSTQVVSTTGRFARIDVDPGTSPSDTSTGFDLELASAEMVDLFTTGTSATGDRVRIIRPVNSVAPLDRVFYVSGKDRSASEITLKGFNVGTEFYAGDVVVAVTDQNTDADSDPNTNDPPDFEVVQYRLEDDPDSSDVAQMRLMRWTTTGGDQVLANKITSMEFLYQLEDGTTTSEVTSDYDKIVAIQINITGKTDATSQASSTGIKTRSIESRIKLRNR